MNVGQEFVPDDEFARAGGRAPVTRRLDQPDLVRPVEFADQVGQEDQRPGENADDRERLAVGVGRANVAGQFVDPGADPVGGDEHVHRAVPPESKGPERQSFNPERPAVDRGGRVDSGCSRCRSRLLPGLGWNEPRRGTSDGRRDNRPRAVDDRPRHSGGGRGCGGRPGSAERTADRPGRPDVGDLGPTAADSGRARPAGKCPADADRADAPPGPADAAARPAGPRGAGAGPARPAAARPTAHAAHAAERPRSEFPARAAGLSVPAGRRESERDPASPPRTDLPAVRPYWNNGLYFATADDAFLMHLGGSMHYDSAWYTAQPSLTDFPGGTGTLRGRDDPSAVPHPGQWARLRGHRVRSRSRVRQRVHPAGRAE